MFHHVAMWNERILSVAMWNERILRSCATFQQHIMWT